MTILISRFSKTKRYCDTFGGGGVVSIVVVVCRQNLLHITYTVADMWHLLIVSMFYICIITVDNCNSCDLYFTSLNPTLIVLKYNVFLKLKFSSLQHLIVGKRYITSDVFVCQSTHPSIYPSICPSVKPSVHPLICPSTQLFVGPSDHPSTGLSILPLVCLLVHPALLSICPFSHPSLHLVFCIPFGKHF